MTASLGLIILLGLMAYVIFDKMRLPGLLGMLILGMIIGPHGFNLLSEEIMVVSSDLRQIALIIILLRAGLGIKRSDLKSVGTAAIKMSCIPGIIEGAMIAVAAHYLFQISFVEGAILGFIIAAVSPAVIVPQMIGFIEAKLGTRKGIPTLILAGASVDDVVAITLMSVFMGMYGGQNMNITMKLLGIPISILLGIGLGIVMGIILVRLFKKYHIRDTKKVLVMIGVAIGLVILEEILKSKIAIASLIGVMTIGFVILERAPEVGERLGAKLGKVWLFAELLLFVLVGAQVNLPVVVSAGGLGLVVLLIGLAGRSIGVWISLIGTDFNAKEKLFCIVAYIPKATVQAAMGAVPLAAGVASGELILAIAVLAIVVTAPLGAIGIKTLGPQLLE
ncbi:MAG: cation:proton antiporter [Cellulosilyticaceae bacterium]